MERDIYLLIANQLRDIHHSLEEKIFNSRTHSPKWEVQEIPNRTMVVELSPLYGIATLLEKLGGQEQASLTVFEPAEGSVLE